MPKTFFFKINQQPYFEGQLLTSRCSARTKRGTRCKRNCIIGYEYCFSHLETEKELKIKDSTISFPKQKKGYLHSIVEKATMIQYLEKTKLLPIITEKIFHQHKKFNDTLIKRPHTV